MNGLGIVLEEREPPLDDKHQSPELKSEHVVSEEEVLLPPLPDSLSSVDPPAPTLVDWIHTHSYSPVSTIDSQISGAASRPTSRSDSLGSEFVPETAFTSYPLDPPSDMVQPFPTESSITPTAAPVANSSPLKRLKSIRKSIRKLSFSSTGSSANSPNLASKPRAAPLLVDTSATDNNDLGLSTCESMNSMGHTLSSISAFKDHRNVETPSTPPFSSPVVTVSDNLQASKKAISSAEQSYFDTVSVSRTHSTSVALSVLSGIVSTGEPSSHQRIKSISELTSVGELLDYSSFLHQQRESVVHAFEVTRKRLLESGWCSSHDLQNLQLQQDTSLSQLDTKLLQVEEKLNAEYDVSLFNKPPPEKKAKERELPKSPSLKVLESRCFSFADI